MAVTIEKKFWNGTEYKDIVKIVFTSPNFTSPATAGTRSHIQPGGQYIGTWYEAVDFIYRQQPNQDAADLTTQMESLFGKMTSTEPFDFTTSTSGTFWHRYGLDYDVVGAGNNILYKDKLNYGTIISCVSGTTTIPEIGTVYTAEITLGDVVGTSLMNEWINSTVVSSVSTTASGTGLGDTNPVSCSIEIPVSGIANDTDNTTVLGTVSGTVTGDMFGTGTVTGTVSGTLVGTLLAPTNDGTGNTVTSEVTGTVSGTLTGEEYGPISGNVSGSLTGTMEAPYDVVSHQYSNITIDAASTVPRSRRHHGANSVIFEVAFGEAYDCRLTAWDDDTHSTTNNKILDEGHCRVDAATYRTTTSTAAYNAILGNERCLIHPPAYDIILKGNEHYYGDFDLIFVIETDEYGEYLVFLPRLADMDNTFSAGNYDFITTLHYQYT